MNFTGSELTIKRNFYTQTGAFGFVLGCIVDNGTGSYQFGISGQQGKIEFKLQSGKLIYENQFIHSYRPNTEFIIEAQFTSGSSNVIKDESPLLFGQPKATGNFDYFYFTRASSDLGATFNLQISGNNLPQYLITDKGYILSSGQNAVTGYFLNQSAFPINVFNSEIQATANYDFGKLKNNIAGYSSGLFAFSGDFDVIDFSEPILTTFNTNYNDTSVLFNIIDARTYNKFIFLTAPNSFTYNSDNVIERTVTWQNYSGGVVTNNYSGELFFALKYVDGSGTFTDNNFATNVPYTGIGYGNYSEFGTITGQTSFVTGNSELSGIYTISFSQNAWATGAATGVFSIAGTGLASGIGYTGLATSQITGFATGFIYDGSGTLSLNQIFTGYSVGSAYSLDYASYTNATGYLNISGMSLGFSFYIGNLATPIIKGVQFINETGLIYYLSGAPQHLVNGVYNNNYITLTSLYSGTLGNGIFVQENDCSQGAGFYSYSSFLTGGTNNGTTGVVVVPIQTFSGATQITITGSGDYAKFISNTGNGIFTYTRSFTGSWDFATGVDGNNLVSLKNTNQYNSNIFSGSGFFAPNSSMTVRITNLSDQVEIDVAQFIISGQEVLNPINQLIYSPNV